jgi:hypothetical protein
MYSLLVHIINEDPVLAEVEDLPAANDQSILLQNPRRRDGKDLHYLMANVSAMVVPMHRVSFIEIIPSEAEEKIVTFVRE